MKGEKMWKNCHGNFSGKWECGGYDAVYMRVTWGILVYCQGWWDNRLWKHTLRSGCSLEAQVVVRQMVDIKQMLENLLRTLSIYY